MGIFQEQNRAEIRQSIGYNLADMMLVKATSTVDTSSLLATYSLAKGGDDEYNGRQVMLATKVGSIVLGEKSFISDFSAATFDATVAPVFTASITTGDIFEMWNVFTVEEVNDAINQAVIEATAYGLVPRQTDTNFTGENEYEYDWLVPFAFGLDFKGLHKVEYVYNTAVSHDVHMCEAVWDELVDGDVTASVDTYYGIQGTYALKLVVADAAAATDILATDSITALDISDCDQIELWIRSSVALSAGDLQLLLDNTASCASPLESLDIPATLANTGTHHVITLANAHLDTAIISVGIKMITNKDAFTLYVDEIKATKSSSKIYLPLGPEDWEIVEGTTPKLKLTASTFGMVGSHRQMRLSGYAAPDIFSDDTTDSEIDPGWIIARVTGGLLIAHAKSRQLDIHDREGKARYWLAEAAAAKKRLTPTYKGNTKWVS